MNTAGWLLTESGRQPWIVQGLMKTSQAASPSVTATDIWISLTVFVLLYAALGVADGYLDGALRPQGPRTGPGRPPRGPATTTTDAPGGPPDEPDDARRPALIY